MNRLHLMFVLLAWGLARCPMADAHQPVMDMAPRWQGGYGFQVRFESFGSGTILAGTHEANNPFDLEKNVETTWLEGIYTFRREVRLSVKVPYVDQSRTVMRDGTPVRLSGSGLGDTVIGIPLKRYKNEATQTGNLAITPSIRLPTGSTSGDNPVGDGGTDVGLSFSASFERADLYQYYDLYYWANGSGDRGMHAGDETGLDINIGWHPYHDNITNSGIFAMADVSARKQNRGRDLFGETGGSRVAVGPVFVYYHGGVMLRVEYKHPVYEDLEANQFSRGVEVNVGIGFVF